MKISLDQQVAALEDTVRNHRSYIRVCEQYVAEGKRPQDVLDDTKRRLPAMEACLQTLLWLQKNREAVLEAHKNLKKAE